MILHRQIAERPLSRRQERVAPITSPASLSIREYLRGAEPYLIAAVFALACFAAAIVAGGWQ